MMLLQATIRNSSKWVNKIRNLFSMFNSKKVCTLEIFSINSSDFLNLRFCGKIINN